MTEYKVIARHFYIIDEHGKHKTLIEKVGYGNIASSYKIKENKKTRKVSSEYYHNELAKTRSEPLTIRKKVEKVKEQKQYDEYDYLISFDYETPANRQTKTITKSGQIKTTDKHSHDFHAEFQMTSPVKLSEHEIRQMILSKFSDYSNVLKEDGYYIHKETNKVSEKPQLSSPTMSKIKRK